MEHKLPDRNSHCVYLLLSKNEKYKGRIYIGYTVDPVRRLKQHNEGVFHGGAYKTNNKGPWEMLLVIHEFPHEVSALRFEWAWQNPHLSRRVKDIKKKSSDESLLNYHLRVLDAMLQSGPWKRIPLNVRVLIHSKLPIIRSHPYLNKVCYIVIEQDHLPFKKFKFPEKKKDVKCYICGKDVVNYEYLECVNLSCDTFFHVNCLATQFLEDDEVVPYEGQCPSCNFKMLWCDVIFENRLTGTHWLTLHKELSH